MIQRLSRVDCDFNNLAAEMKNEIQKREARHTTLNGQALILSYSLDFNSVTAYSQPQKLNNMFPWERLGCQSPPLNPCRTIRDRIRIALSRSIWKYFFALLIKGVSINTEVQQNKTPLHLVIYWKKNLRIVKALLNASADPNAIDCYGHTPLHAAIYSYSSPAIIKALLSAGAKIEKQDALGRSPLMMSIHQNSNACVIQTLLSAGADVNEVDLMVEAVNVNSDPEVIRCLITAGVSVNHSSTYITPLSLAVLNDDLNVVKQLLASGARMDFASGSTLLHEVKGGRVAEELIKYGADMNAINNEEITPLHVAVCKDLVDVAATLIKAGADIHRLVKNYRENCFHLVRSGQMVKMLSSHGLDINAPNIKGWTPLHRLVLINFLLPFYSLQNQTDYELARKFISSVKWMIKCGADINTVDNTGKSVLESSVNPISTKISRYLIKQGVHVPWDRLFSLNQIYYYAIKLMIREWMILNVTGEGLVDYPFHEIPLQMRGLYVYARQCKVEIELMKERKVNCYNSVYHYVVELAPRINALRICPHCEINDENYEGMFPIYKDKIAARLNKCYRRAGMLDILENIDVRAPTAGGRGAVSLENDCKLAIAEHLSEEDLLCFLLAMGMNFSEDPLSPKSLNCGDLSPPSSDSNSAYV